jgi:NTP pyrophosphatase (non-canonical NTP hydrolase)
VIQNDIAAMLAEFYCELGDCMGRGNAFLRMTLHKEEHAELMEALEECECFEHGGEQERYDDARAHLARELADVVYVAFGTAHAFDLDLDAALREIHRAAMSKLDPPCPNINCKGGVVKVVFGGGFDSVICRRCGGTGRGERVIRYDGKVGKPEGFVPPDMTEAVR